MSWPVLSAFFLFFVFIEVTLSTVQSKNIVVQTRLPRLFFESHSPFIMACFRKISLHRSLKKTNKNKKKTSIPMPTMIAAGITTFKSRNNKDDIKT